MAYVHPILPPSQNDWGEYQGYALMAANVPILCTSISGVITENLPFTQNDIKIMPPSPTATLRSLTDEVS